MPLTKYRVNQSLVPSGEGWWFPQPFGKGIQRIPVKGCAGSPKALCEAVLLFRSQHGILLGNYEAEIATHMLRVSPQNILGNAPFVPYEAPVEPVPPLINRVAAWLSHVSNQQPRLIHIDEAKERAEICLKCKAHCEWRTKGHDTMEATIGYRGATVRQCSSHPLDSKLKACRLHDLYLPAAVFVDRDNLPKKLETTPENCWLPD